MGRRFTQAVVVLVVLLAAAQFVPSPGSNPPTDASRTIRAHMGDSSPLVGVVDRACSDCHSNKAAVWPWYGRVAPVSWLLARGVTEGRAAVNFSEWGGYSAEQQRMLLAASCADASAGTMPGTPYTLVRPEGRLSSADIEAICAAARDTEANAAPHERVVTR